MRATIKKYEDFKYILTNSKKYIGQNIIINYINRDKFLSALSSTNPLRAKSYAQNELLFGIMTSKKLGKAHYRVYFKRLVRAGLAGVGVGGFGSNSASACSGVDLVSLPADELGWGVTATPPTTHIVGGVAVKCKDNPSPNQSSKSPPNIFEKTDIRSNIFACNSAISANNLSGGLDPNFKGSCISSNNFAKNAPQFCFIILPNLRCKTLSLPQIQQDFFNWTPSPPSVIPAKAGI